MKVLTWNIRHGGKKKELNNITESLVTHNADLIVLTEFRETLNGSVISKQLFDKGWQHQYSTQPPKGQNGILILSKTPLVRATDASNLPKAAHRWGYVQLPEFNLFVLGIHIPGFNDIWDKRDFWEAVINFAQENIHNSCLIVGDFNTGLKKDCEGTPFKLSEYMIQLNELGWVDTWRHLHPEINEYTWYSNKDNGFRIDYIFAAPSLKEKLLDAYHSYDERIKGYSDHSILAATFKD